MGLGFGKKKLIESIIKTNWGIVPTEKEYNFNELLFVIQELFAEEGKSYSEGSSIERGHHKFRAFIELLVYRNIANYDSMILITAPKGTGKSSAGIMLCKEWCRRLGIKFNPKRHIAYTNADISRKIDELNKFEPLLCDESINFCLASEWSKKENKELKKKLAQVRTKHLFFVLCFPLKVEKIEKTYLDSFVNYWIDLFGRGIGACYVKDMNPAHDAWRIKDFRNVGSYSEFTEISKIQKKLSKHPNFWSILKIPKPSKQLYEKYLAVREKNVYDHEAVLSSVTKEDIHNALLILTLKDIMMTDTNMSINRLILHIDNKYDLKLNKAAIQVAVKDSKMLIQKIREQALSV